MVNLLYDWSELNNERRKHTAYHKRRQLANKETWINEQTLKRVHLFHELLRLWKIIKINCVESVCLNIMYRSTLVQLNVVPINDIQRYKHLRTRLRSSHNTRTATELRVLWSICKYCIQFLQECSIISCNGACCK